MSSNDRTKIVIKGKSRVQFWGEASYVCIHELNHEFNLIWTDIHRESIQKNITLVFHRCIYLIQDNSIYFSSGFNFHSNNLFFFLETRPLVYFNNANRNSKCQVIKVAKTQQKAKRIGFYLWCCKICDHLRGSVI